MLTLRALQGLILLCKAVISFNARVVDLGLLQFWVQIKLAGGYQLRLCTGLVDVLVGKQLLTLCVNLNAP